MRWLAFFYSACLHNNRNGFQLRFWYEVERTMLPVLLEQRRSFVVVLAQLDGNEPLLSKEHLTVLQTPVSFDLTEFFPWVQGMLEHFKIEPRDIEHCLNRLRYHRGDVIRTYREMETIEDYLRTHYS